MTAFPPDWQIYEDSEFFSFGTVGAGAGVQLHVLLQLHDNGRTTGLFRLALAADENITMNMPLAILFPDVPDHFKGMILKLECSVADATPPPNTLVTVWKDVEELVRF
jgi:hypothetical protein